MIDVSLSQTIAAIHASGCQLVLEFTGAGSLGLAWLHSVPGSSRTILEATDRYSTASLAELLGYTPEKNVSPETAMKMAEKAYIRACRLGDDDKIRLGVACTATIATDRAKRGEHRCCITVFDKSGARTSDLVLTKGERDRDGEETLVAKMLINAIAEAAGVGPVHVELLETEQIKVETIAAPDPLQATWALIEPDGNRVAQPPISGCIYPGSFNPLHYGHEALAAAAERITGLPVTFELAAVNADKAPLARGELERRLEQFRGKRRVLATRAPLFSDKARLFRGCTFVIGYDTAVRFLDKRFYGDSETARDQSLATLRECGCKLLIASRVDGAIFRTLRHLAIPQAAADLFIELPESAFRADISATILRAAR